jgi:transposase
VQVLIVRHIVIGGGIEISDGCRWREAILEYVKKNAIVSLKRGVQSEHGQEQPKKREVEVDRRKLPK